MAYGLRAEEPSLPSLLSDPVVPPFPRKGRTKKVSSSLSDPQVSGLLTQKVSQADFLMLLGLPRIVFQEVAANFPRNRETIPGFPNHPAVSYCETLLVRAAYTFPLPLSKTFTYPILSNKRCTLQSPDIYHLGTHSSHYHTFFCEQTKDPLENFPP